MQKYQSIISGTNGSVIRNVPVTVLKEDGSLAEIFMDREGQVQAPNPLVTDSRGVFYFYAKNGRYSLRTAADGVQITDADTVLLFDPDETVADGPIADAVRRAEDAAERAETALEDSGLQNLVQDAQDAAANAVQAVIDANQAVASIDAALIEAGEAKDAAQAAAQTASNAASGAQAVKDSLLTYSGTLSATPEWSAVPAHEDLGLDAQTQAALNRVEKLKDDQQLLKQRADKSVLSYPDYAAASAAAATLPDGQHVEVVGDETHGGRSTLYVVQSGALAFERYTKDAISLTDFGKAGSGISDDTDVFAAAAASGQTVYVPKPDAHYLISGTIYPANGTQFVAVDDLPEVRFISEVTACGFDMSGKTGAGIVGIKFVGDPIKNPNGVFVLLDGSTGCTVQDNNFIDTPSNVGTVQLTGVSSVNAVRGNKFVRPRGSGIGLSGYSVSRNDVHHNEFEDCQGFGVHVLGGANRNLIAFNKTERNGIELIGVTSDCYLNRVLDNHAEGAGDNGISISGYQNTVTGNTCVKNTKAGIWVWGSFNTVVGNVCLSNNQENGNVWSGIGVSANYGGCGQFNTITGNICDDDQLAPTQHNGVRMAGSAYTPWASGAAVSHTDYRVNGLNIYVCLGSGTTGATPPTHTSGSASDGGVSWRFVRSFIDEANAVFNNVISNVVPRYKSADYFDAGDWAKNILVAEKYSNIITRDVLTIGSTTTNVHVRVAGTQRWRFENQYFRPEADGTNLIGLANRRLANVHSQQMTLTPPATATPGNNGELVFQLTNNTTLTLKVKGSDGVVRSGSITLA